MDLGGVGCWYDLRIVRGGYDVQVIQDDFRMTWSTQSIKQTFRELLESTQRAREQSDYVIPS